MVSNGRPPCGTGVENSPLDLQSPRVGEGASGTLSAAWIHKADDGSRRARPPAGKGCDPLASPTRVPLDPVGEWCRLRGEDPSALLSDSARDIIAFRGTLRPVPSSLTELEQTSWRKRRQPPSNAPPGSRGSGPRAADLRPWLECYLDLCATTSQAERGRRQGLRSAQAARRMRTRSRRADASSATARPFARRRMQGGRLAGPHGGRNRPRSAGPAAGRRSLSGWPNRARRAPHPASRSPFQIRPNQVRTLNGLPEPPDSIAAAKDDPLRQLGRFRQTCRAALLAGDKTAAAKALQKITKQIPDVDQFWLKPGLTLNRDHGLPPSRGRRGPDPVCGLAGPERAFERSRHGQPLGDGPDRPGEQARGTWLPPA